MLFKFLSFYIILLKIAKRQIRECKTAKFSNWRMSILKKLLKTNISYSFNFFNGKKGNDKFRNFPLLLMRLRILK